MRKVGCLIASLLALLLLLAFAYILYELLGVGKFPTIWNQKVMMVVETPSGDVQASSVTQMKIVPTGALTGDGRRSNTYLSGEAVVMNLGKDASQSRYLFALLKQFRKSEKGKIVTIPSDKYPMLVTFDDINDPKTVKRVDPDDLDGAFGCARDQGNYPWRSTGQAWREWLEQEAEKLAFKGAAQRAGIAAGAAAAIEEILLMNTKQSPQYGSKEQKKARRKELKKQYSAKEYRRFREARMALYKEMIRDVPAPLIKPPQNPCHNLKSITLEITNEPVTEGRVEKVLGWLEAVGRERASLLPYRKDDKEYNALSKEIRNVAPSNFSTELYE